MEEYEEVAQYEENEQKYDESDDMDDDTDVYTGSEPTPLGGLYALFGDLVERRKTYRVANLHQSELGLPLMTVRDALHIAQLGHTFGHKRLAELFVTSKKFASRQTSTSLGLPDDEKSKKKLFGKKN
jgi:hypothetical protein